VIADRGLDRARYTDIARESGTPISTLQNAFGNLEALLAEAISYAITRDEDFLASIPGSTEADAPQRLEALVTGAMGDEYGIDSWLVWLELWRGTARDSSLAQHATNAYERWWSTAESIIRHGQNDGHFTNDLPARDLAISIVALLDGCAVALLLRSRQSDPATARRVTLASARRLLAI
jgi:AcrR family transcriptional regulator